MPLPHPDTTGIKPPTSGRVILAASLGLVGLATAYFGFSWLLDDRLVTLFPREGLTLAEVSFLIVGGPVVLWFVVVTHELGHVVGGLVGGFQFRLLVAGPLRMENREVLDANQGSTPRNRLSLGWNRSWVRLAGYAVCTPVPGADVRRGMMRSVAGGPGASLLLGGIVLVLALSMTAETGSATVGRGLAGLFGAGSLIVGLTTLVPGHPGGFPTDGSRLLLFLRNDGETRAALAVLATTELAAAGERPRDWPDDLIRNMRQAKEPRIRGAALTVLYQHLLDRGQPVLAGRELSGALRLAKALPAVNQTDLALEAAFFAARFQQDDQLARAWFAVALTLPHPHPEAVSRAHVALANTPEDRERALAEAVSLLAESPRPGLALMYRELLAVTS